MSKVTVVGAIANKNGATLYLIDGRHITLHNNGYRTKAILDEIAPSLAKHKPVTITLKNYSATAMVEKKSGGLIKFIRRKVGELLGTPVGQEHVIENGLPENEELVAVVGGVEIPQVEKLAPYIEDAAWGESYPGFEKFMKRLAAVASKRGHTAQELLNFMKRGDLPIADDGCIVAYKALRVVNQSSKYPDHPWVDKYSSNVPQRVGSFVTMSEELVDPSRRTQCSTGLHIARRGYLRYYLHSSDAVVITKIAPEDVIAVPEREPDKTRVAGYLICAVLPDECKVFLSANEPMTSNEEAARILGAVLRGNHTKRIETVQIGSANGGDITITPETGVKIDAVAPVQPMAEPVHALDDIQPKKLDVKSLNQIKAAALSGDMSAALNEPEPVKATEPVRSKPKPKSVKKTKKSAPKASSNQVDIRNHKALQMRDEGKSMRAIAAELKMCRKTLRKLFDANPTSK